MNLSILEGVNLHTQTNNTKHHTSDITVDQLIVRRGQPFTLTLHLTEAFSPDLHPLTMVVQTGEFPSEERGTKSCFGVPDDVQRSPSAKAPWRAEPQWTPPLLTVAITPPANAPIGEYKLSVKHEDQEVLLGELVVLFNPWCPDDWVFLPQEEERQEYVMNEHGTIYKGSGDYITSMSWDYAQFEDDMVMLCLKILDMNNKHVKDPSEDVSARCNPIYVSRVVSAMINSEDDHGVLKGNWGGTFWGGVLPTHWNGSHAILRKWYDTNCYPVRYGQCWVFAGVMCSVMRLLGIPCRIITNYQSAHDNNKNLLIDVYHADYGVREKPSKDSVWNYHVWVEGWMRRPDLADDGKYDGWQVLDPTPQEKSNGVYCCGPAPVSAVLNGDTHLKYDISFVFAEVNADCIDWLVKANGSKVKIFSDTNRIGQNISTKSVDSNNRVDITDTYKHREGSEKERAVFEYAIKNSSSLEEKETGGTGETRGTEESHVEETGRTEENHVEETGRTEESHGEETGRTEENHVEETGRTEENHGEETGRTEENHGEETGRTEENHVEETGRTEERETGRGADEETGNVVPPLPLLSMRFEEVSRPMNGKDVSLKLLLHSESGVSRPLSIKISVQAMRYYGSLAAIIQTEVREETLQPGTELAVPVLVRFSTYHTHMLQCDSMKVSAVVTDRMNAHLPYLAEDNIVLLDPPISLNVSSLIQLHHEAIAEVVFTNPVDEVLTGCSLTLTGSGLLREQVECRLPDLQPNNRVRIHFFFFPYKSGLRTLMADFDCSTFRDVKTSSSVTVTP